MKLLNKEEVFDVSYEVGNIYVFSETRAFLLTMVIRQQPSRNIYQMVSLLNGDSNKDEYKQDEMAFIGWSRNQSTSKYDLVDDHIDTYGNPIKIIHIKDVEIKL